MKNHWIKLNKIRNSQFCTIEFTRNGTHLLKPRKIETDTSCLQKNQGDFSVTFCDAVSNSSDKELNNFLSNCYKLGMYAQISVIKFHNFDSLKEKQSYELAYLNFKDMIIKNEDIKFIFSFRSCRHFII